MASDAQRIRDAAARYGHTLDAVAARYRNPRTGQRLSGEALILKTIQGESGGRRDAVSKAGARAWAQFMPGTRAGVIKQFGVDPWRSPEEAVHALTLHMRGKLGNATGLEGYNPGGGQGYVNYILGQRVGSTRGAGGRARGGTGRSAPATTGGGRATLGTTSGSSGSASAPPSPFSPGGLSTRLLSLEQAPAISTAGPSLPSGLRPRYYQDVPSFGPPNPPPDPSLPDVGGQNVSFGEPAAPASSGRRSTSGAPVAAASGSTGSSRASFGAGRGAAGRRSPVAHMTSEGGEHPTAGLAGFPARDYFAHPGTAAVAPVNGRVVRLSGHDPAAGPTNGPHGPLGWSVYIKGDDGRTYFLTHMGSRGVKVGQRLRAGQKIGTVADYDKYGTPSHIHMGVQG